MSNLVSEEIEKYCENHSTPEAPVFAKLVEETYSSTEIPQMQVGHLEGAFLKMLVRLTQARRILEIGTFTGYSALSMAEALSKDGELITCDIDPENTKIAQKHWDRSPDGKKIRLVLGSALDSLKKLEGPFDMVFIDADKENYLNYWEAVLPKVVTGGLIVVDNVLWSGNVLNPKDETDHAIVKFNDKAREDSRVELVMLTVRDGMTLAWKK